MIRRCKKCKIKKNMLPAWKNCFDCSRRKPKIKKEEKIKYKLVD